MPTTKNVEEVRDEVQDLKNRIEQMNENMNSMQEELDRVHQESGYYQNEAKRLSDACNDLSKKVGTYREALIALCKEINA